MKGQEPKQFILSVLPDAIPHVGRPDPGPRVRKQISLLVQWLANLATAKRKDEKVDESASKEEDTNKFATAFKLVNFLLGKLSSFTKKNGMTHTVIFHQIVSMFCRIPYNENTKIARVVGSLPHVFGCCWFLYQAFAPPEWGNEQTVEKRVIHVASALGQMGLAVQDFPSVKLAGPINTISGQPHLKFIARLADFAPEFVDFIKVCTTNSPKKSSLSLFQPVNI